MKALLLLVLLTLSGIAASAQSLTPSPKGSSDDILPNYVRVKLTPEAFAGTPGPTIFGSAATDYGIDRLTPWLNPGLVHYRIPYLKSNGELQALSLRRIVMVHFAADARPEEVARRLNGLPGVEYAEVVGIPRLMYTPNDPDVARQWYLELIHAPEAWDVVRADTSVIIAIVDTGIERTHEDLKAAIWRNPGENGKDGQGNDKATNGIDDDGNGYVDDYIGYDFSGFDNRTPDNDPTPTDDHGTLVASLAAATGDNNVGLAGVGFGARMMALKVADEAPNPELLTGFEGVLYAAKMGARVINCSWGDVNPSRAEQEVVDVVTRDYHSLIVAAAGNEGKSSLMYPASYRGVISVGATGKFDEKANFSRFNYRVDLAAPGVDMYGATIGNGYKTDIGTSMSSPIVSGAAALVVRQFPGLDAEQIGEILRSSTDDISGSLDPSYTDKLGTGRLNVLRAVTQGPGIASARMIDYQLIDESGDGVADPGEKVSIRAVIKNILAPATNVSVEMTPVSYPPLGIENQQIALGSMFTGEIKPTPDGSFTFTVPNLSANTPLLLKLSVATGDRTNNEYISIQVAPTYATTDHNDIAVTFNSTGNIGFDGFNTGDGDGFSLGSSKNLLFHGGVLVGISGTQVSDVVRTGGFTQGASDGFELIRPYRLRIASDSSVEIGTAEFDDAHRNPSFRVGVDVEMTTKEFREDSLNNIVIVNYRLRNTTDATLSNLHCGIYLDWDVGVNGERDHVDYDPVYLMGYQRNVDSKPDYMVGATLLSGQDLDFYAIDNDDPDDGVNDFPASKKWRMLSGGIARKTSSIGDVSMMIGGGPVALEPNGTVDVAFALIASHDLQTMRASADRARAIYNQVSAVPSTGAIADAMQVRIHPNPMRSTTTIGFTLPESGRTTVEIYDITGRMVRTLLDESLDQGTHQAIFDGTGLPSGAYIYRIHSGDLTTQGTIVKVQ